MPKPPPRTARRRSITRSFSASTATAGSASRSWCSRFALDARGARIRAELDEAKALRAEAEALLAEHKRQQAAAEKDAEAIIAHARQEAGQIVAAAQKSAEAMVARRAAMAEAKIGAAERAAETELRARAANLATAAAAQIIAGSTDKATKTKLTDAAISELDRRLH